VEIPEHLHDRTHDEENHEKIRRVVFFGRRAMRNPDMKYRHEDHAGELPRPG